MSLRFKVMLLSFIALVVCGGGRQAGGADSRLLVTQGREQTGSDRFLLGLRGKVHSA